MISINLLPHQRDFVENPASECLFSGAYGAGKSVSLCAKIVFLLDRYPKTRGFLCRKTLQSLKTTTLKTLLEGDGGPPVLPPHLIQSHNKQDRLITLYNGSELYYGPMDIDFIKSMNLGFCAVDEATELLEDEWNALNGRLRLANTPIRQVFGATNPAGPTHWLYTRFKGNPREDTYIRESSVYDNPYLPKTYVKNLEETLFGHYYKRYVLGLWEGSEGAVYDNFDPRKHIIPSFEIPSNWKRWRAVDFGYRSPFTCGWFAQVGETIEDTPIKKGDIILYKELYYTERTVTVNAKRIKEFSQNEKFIGTVADWDAGDRADLEAEGIKTLKANKDITYGIQKVRERLGNIDPTRGLIVEPRFFIFQNSLQEIDPKIQVNLETGKKNNNPVDSKGEFMVYSWKKDVKGKIQEEPEDIYNHSMDMIRYFFATIDTTQQWRNIPFAKV